MEKTYTKMTKYKLLAIDLDGTLLSKLKQISKSNLEALKEYTDSGGIPVITTGRSIVSVSRIVKKIDSINNNKSEYAICFNGAYIKNFHTGEVAEKMIPNEIVREIYQYVRDNSIVLWAYTKDATERQGVYVTKTFANLVVRFGKGVNLLKITKDTVDLSSYKLNILSFSKKKIAKAWKDLHEKYGDKLNYSYSNPRLLEVNLGGVNKGAAIDHVANMLKIEKSQIAAIGDSNNDLAAFKSASLKIAVKSKSKRLIKAASVYLPYSHNAVATAIRRYVLSSDRQIQLIASDLDGTLLKNGSKTISLESKTNIEKVVNDLNKKFVVCTGRNIDDILLVTDYLNIKNKHNLFAIGANGGLIYDIANKNFIFEKLMSESFAKKVIDKFNIIKNDSKTSGQLACEVFVSYKAMDVASHKPQTHYCINNPFIESMYTKFHPGMLKNFWSKRFVKDVDENTPFGRTLKVIFYFESQDDKARMFASLNEFKNDLEISSSGKHNIEVMPLNVTKGHALQRLCNYLNIDIKDTMPIGDEKNDISMLLLSPHSVTLKTSGIDVQQSASNVLDQPTSDVVGKAIELFILKK